MTTKLNRNIGVLVVCGECGIEFLQKRSRVLAGIGKFCSKACFDVEQLRRGESKLGYENGRKHWNGSRWFIQWRDESRVAHNTSYPRWWWTLNVGEVPEGYMISYIDGNQENIDPSNFECITRKEAMGKGGKSQLGKLRPSIAGANSKWWKGGKPKEYPPEFSKGRKRFIKTRDNYTCQSCFCAFDSRALDVHHIDRDKNHNVDENLITLCKSCHKAVHGKENKTNYVIEELKNLLRDSNSDVV
jgi:hypothetical protein